jgi:hypothetical protein
MYDWNSAATLVPLAFSMVGLVGFFYYNTHVSKEPFIRNSLFSSSTARAAYFGAVSHGILVYSVLFYIPLYFESARGYSPVMSGAALLPYTLTTGIAVITTGLLISRTDRYRLYVRIGWIVTSLGTGLLLVLARDTSAPASALIGVVGGLGLGIVWSAGSFAAQASASQADLPFAAAMFTFLRAVGQAVGVSLGGVIFQNVFKRRIGEDPTYAPYARRLAQDASAIVSTVNNLTGPEDQSLRNLLISAYVDGFRAIWLVMCVISTASAIVNVIWVKDISLGQGLAVEHYVRNGQKRTIKTFRYPGPEDWI